MPFIDDEKLRNQWNAKKMQQSAMDDYARQKEQIDQAHPDKQTGLSGLLSSLFKDVKAAGNTVGTTLAAFASPFNDAYHGFTQKSTLEAGKADKDKIAQKYGYKDWDTVAASGEGPDEMWAELQGSAKNTDEKFKKNIENYNNNLVTKTINDAKQSQYGADAIRTWKNLGLFMVPAAAATPVGGGIAGALDGFADSVENADGTLVDLQSIASGGKIKSAKDTNMDWGDALKRSAIGATAGAITAGIGSKIGNAQSGLGSRLLNNKFITSGVGRGAVSGAVGGAIGGGLGAALEGGDIAGSALQGAGSGALTGGISGGVASGAKKIGNIAANKLGIADNLQAAREKLMYSPQEQPQLATTNENDVRNVLSNEAAAEADLPDYTTPRDWAGNEVKLQRKNFIAKAGDAFSKTGDSIKNQDIYNRLDKKTADQMVQNGSIQKLKKLGFSAGDYDDAATLSTVTNKFFDDIIKNSGAAIVDNDLSSRLKTLPKGVSFSDSDAKTFNRKINALNDVLESNNMPGQYGVDTLLTQSREFASEATAAYKNGHKDLGKSYNKISKDLRALADKGTDNIVSDDYTKQQLTTMLKNAGANDKVTKYLTNYKDLTEAIRNTSLLEDARTMSRQMKTSNLARNGMSGENSERVTTQLARKTGAPQIIGTALSPLGKISGTIVSGVGKGLSALGGASNIEPIPTATPISPDMQNLYNILGMKIGSVEGDNARSTAIKNREYKNIEDQLAGTMAQAEELYNRPVQNTASSQVGDGRMASQLDYISNAMDQALAAGDITSYSKLASLYKDAYDIYKTQAKSSGSDAKLSKTQVQANAASDILDQLESMNPDYGYAVRDIPVLNLVNARGNSYSATADSLATQIGYMLSGANIKDDELEYIKKEFVPQPFDSEEQRRYKLQRARNLIKQYQTAYSDATVANNGINTLS